MNPLVVLEGKLPDLYKDSSCDHDLGHIQRVVRNARIIGEREGADLDVLIPAAMLHDIALKKGTLAETNDKHAALGSDIAEGILRELGFEKVDQICSAIRQHSLDNPTDEPRSREGDCLFDADKVEAITPVGFARYLQERALVKNMGPMETASKCSHFLKNFRFRTKTGQELGKDRSDVLEFCEKIIQSSRV
jgi:HD superfamily phosphodiesterase